jgi:hypothetical protein
VVKLAVRFLRYLNWDPCCKVSQWFYYKCFGVAVCLHDFFDYGVDLSDNRQIVWPILHF